ncbi:unnamed protein product [Ranitomeya imitator]|uniref:Reverse transcriptase domain-containing protein n=1 Tax=Ranitomeya imitator TaxID=111125 RepID=A0ABN9KW00_9NEOB|nr:unnamed protein product [Ranitomeya imitator]
MLDKEPRLTSKQVQASLQSEGTTVSTRTIRRRLNEKGLYDTPAGHVTGSSRGRRRLRRRHSHCCVGRQIGACAHGPISGACVQRLRKGQKRRLRTSNPAERCVDYREAAALRYYVAPIVGQTGACAPCLGKLQGDPTYSIQRKISTVIDKYMSLGTIDSKTKTYLTNHHPVTPVLYILPKIHKNLQNPPGRPIVASTDSVLNPLSKFLEKKILTPYTKLTKSFILDTSDFLSKIRNISNIPPDSLLCTLDVNSLYTSIAHDRGVTAVSLTLQEVGIDRNTHDLCLDLLNLVLRENFFLFEDDFFVQTCGTAMGSNVAPAYANLYMDHFEREHVYANPIFQQNALVWYRYIDDIFCIWQGNHTSLQGFYDAINTTLPELTFTLTHHDSEITFLDTKVLKNPLGQLTFCTTNLFGKRVLDGAGLADYWGHIIAQRRRLSVVNTTLCRVRCTQAPFLSLTQALYTSSGYGGRVRKRRSADPHSSRYCEQGHGLAETSIRLNISSSPIQIK